MIFGPLHPLILSKRPDSGAKGVLPLANYLTAKKIGNPRSGAPAEFLRKLAKSLRTSAKMVKVFRSPTIIFFPGILTVSSNL